MAENEELAHHYWINPDLGINCPECDDAHFLRGWHLPHANFFLCYACGTLFGTDPIAILHQFQGHRGGWGAGAMAFVIANALGHRVLAIDVNRSCCPAFFGFACMNPAENANLLEEVPFPDPHFARILGVFDNATGIITPGGHSYLDSIAPYIFQTGNEFADKISAMVKRSLSRAHHVKIQARQIQDKVDTHPWVPHRVRREVTLKRERAKGLRGEVRLFLARAISTAAIVYHPRVVVFQSNPHLHFLQDWQGILNRAREYAFAGGIAFNLIALRSILG